MYQGQEAARPQLSDPLDEISPSVGGSGFGGLCCRRTDHQCTSGGWERAQQRPSALSAAAVRGSLVSVCKAIQLVNMYRCYVQSKG